MGSDVISSVHRKRWVPPTRDPPFPVPMESLTKTGNSWAGWHVYTGFLWNNCVFVKHTGDMDWLYRMGFFGKGTLSRSEAEFNKRQYSRMTGHGIPKVISKRRFLRHQTWQKLKAAKEEKCHAAEVSDEESNNQRRINRTRELAQPPPRKRVCPDPSEVGGSKEMGPQRGGYALGLQGVGVTDEIQGEFSGSLARSGGMTDVEMGVESQEGVQQDVSKLETDAWDNQEADYDFWGVEPQEVRKSEAVGSAERLESSKSEADSWTAACLTEVHPTEFSQTKICSSQTKGDSMDVDSGGTKIDLSQTKVRSSPAEIDSPQTNVDLLQTEVDSTQTNINLSQTKVGLSRTKISLSQTEMDSSQTKVSSSPSEVDLSQTEGTLSQTEVTFPQTEVDLSQTELALSQTKDDLSQTNIDSSGFGTKVDSSPRKVAVLQTKVNSKRTDVDVMQTKDFLSVEESDSKNHTKRTPTSQESKTSGSCSLNVKGSFEVPGLVASTSEQKGGVRSEELGARVCSEESLTLSLGSCGGPMVELASEVCTAEKGDQRTSTLQGESEEVQFDVRSAEDDSNGDVLVMEDSETEELDEEWRPCLKIDAFPVEEYLQLSLEEAFFLMYGLGCLRLLDQEQNCLNLSEAWCVFCRLRDSFLPSYIAYHYYRSKGWVPKTGLKYGSDFLLYRQGPPFYHSSHSVLVQMVNELKLKAVPEFTSRPLTWSSLAGVDRVIEHVAKAVLYCYVVKPERLAMEDLKSPRCIQEFTVQEILLKRWVSSQEREGKEETK